MTIFPLLNGLSQAHLEGGSQGYVHGKSGFNRYLQVGTAKVSDPESIDYHHETLRLSIYVLRLPSSSPFGVYRISFPSRRVASSIHALTRY